MNYTNFDKQIKVIECLEGDVNGDGISDHVYLVGKPYEKDSPFTTNITLVIQDGKTGILSKVPLKENSGYNPGIFLGDFTGDKVNDILVSINTGGSGGYAYYYLYTVINHSPYKIFDSEDFNKYKYDVTYLDNYEVEINSKDKNYIINILYRGSDYLKDIYTNGKLKQPIKGWVNPLGGLYPIDFNRDGIYNLYAVQSIAGRYNADRLGYVQTSLEWNGMEFVPYYQTLGILG